MELFFEISLVKTVRPRRAGAFSKYYRRKGSQLDSARKLRTVSS